MTYEDKLWIWKLARAVVWSVVCYRSGEPIADLSVDTVVLHNLKPVEKEDK